MDRRPAVHNLEAIGHRHAATAAEAERRRHEVVREVIARYGDAILAVHALEVARQSVDIASAHVAMARDRVDGGIAVESDLLQTRVQESATRQALDMAERDLELATGQDLGTPIHLPTSFEAIEPASRPRG